MKIYKRNCQVHSLMTALLFAFALNPSAHAALVNYQFSANGFSGGGSLSGSFQAKDITLDGVIKSSDDEVFSFEYSFTGDSIVDDVILTQAELNSLPENTFDISFVLDDEILISGEDFNDHMLLVHYIEDETGTLPLVETVLISDLTGECGGCTGVQKTLLSGDVFRSETSESIRITAVPIPGAGWFMMSALASLTGCAQFRKKFRF